MNDDHFDLLEKKVKEIYSILEGLCNKKDVPVPPLVVWEADGAMYCDESIEEEDYFELIRSNKSTVSLPYEKLFMFGVSNEPQISECLGECVAGFLKTANPDFAEDRMILSKNALALQYSFPAEILAIATRNHPVFKDEEARLSEIISKFGVEKEDLLHINAKLLDFAFMRITYGECLLSDSLGLPKPRVYEEATVFRYDAKFEKILELAKEDKVTEEDFKGLGTAMAESITKGMRLKGDLYGVELYETDKTLLPDITDKNIVEAHVFIKNIYKIIGEDRFNRVQQIAKILSNQ